jgi:glycosyltransferase involved in cell wall biosynthesis
MHALGQNDWHCGLCGQPLARESPRRPASDVVFSIVIPVRNETDQIAQNLSLIHAEASKTGLPMDMIVIDDGSTDSTWQALEKTAEQMPELKALRFSRNV